MNVLNHDFAAISQYTPNGWCSPQKAQHLYELAIQSGLGMSLELGVFSGRSLIPLGIAHKDNNRGFALGVDTWSKQAALEGTNDKDNDEWWESLNYHDLYKECNVAIDSLSLNDYCGTVRMKSTSFGLLVEKKMITLIHQDSNHSEEVTCAEVELFAPDLKPGTIWVSDDSRWPTVQKSLSLLEFYGFELIGEFENGDNFYKAFIKR